MLMLSHVEADISRSKRYEIRNAQPHPVASSTPEARSKPRTSSHPAAVRSQQGMMRKQQEVAGIGIATANKISCQRLPYF